MRDKDNQSDYKLLAWSGPYDLFTLHNVSIPTITGLYVLTNSPSPFAFRSLPERLEPNLYSEDYPQILYVGQSSNLRARILQLSRANSPHRLGHYLSSVSDVYVYWAVTDEARALELSLVADIAPLLNITTPELANAASSNSLSELEWLLGNQVTDESEYQKFFERNSWVFGLQFSAIEAHNHFNDENIPDFTGVRSRDCARDILEIKQPFLSLQRADSSLNSDFHEAWAQAERYLDFARMEADYLERQKGLRFENPYCYLIIGYKPNTRLRRELSRKNRMNPSIIVITYDQVLRMARETIRLVRTVPSLDV